MKLHDTAALAAALLRGEAPAENFHYIDEAHEDLDLLFALTKLYILMDLRWSLATSSAYPLTY
jgi:hypothetical protein